MSEAALLAEEALGFRYASDTRGTGPFVPWIAGRRGHCPQLPTTLPTLDELIGLDGITAASVHEPLLRLTAAAEQGDGLQVFTLHAELEGMKLRPSFERLLQGWRAQGYAMVSLARALASLDVEHLPVGRIEVGTIAGRSGTLAVQGPAPASAAGHTPG
jgi:peptidoglycan/xylan/chitin deacetylase (PgdA/CDA1 family)